MFLVRCAFLSIVHVLPIFQDLTTEIVDKVVCLAQVPYLGKILPNRVGHVPECVPVHFCYSW